MTRTQLLLAVAVSATLLIALTIYLTLLLRRAVAARRLTHRMAQAASAELLAERWLIARGYQVLDRQLTTRSTIWVNDHPTEFDIRADLLVQMGAERVLVEVKTGDAADPRSPATRRQLREYAAVYGVTVLYLFDADRQQLHRIDFGQLSEPDEPAPGAEVA